jgi:hypothetical protein
MKFYKNSEIQQHFISVYELHDMQYMGPLLHGNAHGRARSHDRLGDRDSSVGAELGCDSREGQMILLSAAS